MKKEYEAPKAEKVEFNYSEAVVASTKCDFAHKVGWQTGDDCQTHVYPGTYENNNEA